jgi:xylulokinase
MAHFLGLDSSTQSLSALIIDTDSGRVALDMSVNFGRDLPEYESPNGFLQDPDPNVKHADPLMWVAAIDRLFRRIRGAGYDLGKIQGISGAGQQHGSVYLKTPISKAPAWKTDKPLAEQVRPLLSRQTSPIWMDSSTSRECREIADAVGGDSVVTQITGSRTIERFTGPQIRKFYKQSQHAYEQTQEIHLVSSFVASILTGTSAPIDFGDGAGMNLLELATGSFNERLLDATAPELGGKLPMVAPSRTRVGAISDYFVQKYGFCANIPIFAFSGDNPSSLVGMGATRPGLIVISLGTSDTVFAAMSQPRTDPRGYGHVFGNPAGGFMSLICFTNGSLAREEVAKKHELSWDAFSHAILEETVPGNGGSFMLPYFVPETTPRLLRPTPRYFGSEAFMAQKEPAAAARGIVESQAISMRLHSDWIGERPEALLVTGGASRNRGILQVLADVFEAELRTFSVGNSSALGGAMRAAHVVERTSWDDLAKKFAAPDPGSSVQPNPAASSAYGELRARFKEELAKILDS